MNNKDLGIISLNITNNSETKDLITLAKSYFSNNPYSQTCFFSTSCGVTSSNEVPIFHLSQAKFFHGNILVKDIKSLELSINFPNIKNILYFALDIPWQQEIKNYKEWEKIFYQDKLTIIAKSKEISDIFEICYRKPQYISERLTYEKIQECL